MLINISTKVFEKAISSVDENKLIIVHLKDKIYLINRKKKIL